MIPNFPERLDLAQLPTPLQRLTRVSDAVGVNLWIKRDDLTGCTLSGNKIRKLEFTLAHALKEGCDSVVTCGGIQSNHCRATALLGAQLGLKVSLVLRGESMAVGDGNFLLDQLAGAEIQCFPARQFAAELPELMQQAAEKLQQEGHKPFIIPTGASDGVGLWGYLAAVRELEVDFHHKRIVPSHIVMATGSGGTQAGLALGAYLQGWQSQVVGMAVCDDAAYFHHKVRQDMRQWQQRYAPQVDVEDCPIHVNDRYIGPGYAKAEAEVFDTISWLARTEGIVLDPVYTGKAFHGLLQELKAGRLAGARDVVFVHTGGVFGCFPYKSQFSDSLD